MADPAANRLIDEFEARLRDVELVVGTRVMASWADAAELSLHEARLILVMATSNSGSTTTALAELGGIDIADVYRSLGTLKDRGLVREADKSLYVLTDRGQESLASLNSARREGILAYVARLEDEDRRSLEAALGVNSDD